VSALRALLFPVAILAASQRAAATHLLIVSGVGGEATYSEGFYRAGLAMADAASKRFGIPDSSVIFLAEDSVRDPARIRGRSTRENISTAIASLATRSRVGDQVMILFIGHGSGSGDEARFNLPGPDLSPADLRQMLKKLDGRTVAVVDASSASGDFLKPLSAPGRIIITATKSGFERNESIFAKYFVAAFSDDVADTDKDGRVSLFEAFAYARRETVRSYESDHRLLTEHAQLDDDGDGVGTADPAANAKDGQIARRFALGAGGTVAAAPRDPALAPLYAQRDSLEAQVASLRSKKSSMPSADYDRQLETLLVNLATKNQAIRKAEGKP
jgi:hypothetical protein